MERQGLKGPKVDLSATREPYFDVGKHESKERQDAQAPLWAELPLSTERRPFEGNWQLIRTESGLTLRRSRARSTISVSDSPIPKIAPEQVASPEPAARPTVATRSS